MSRRRGGIALGLALVIAAGGLISWNVSRFIGAESRTRTKNITFLPPPVLAEALKTLGFVNRFGRGVKRAQTALEANGSPPAEFIFSELHFGVTVRARP